MYRALISGWLVACGGPSTHAPAWPKPHLAELDGGESIAPHLPHPVAETGLGKSDDDPGKPAAPPAATGSAAAPTETSAAAPTTPVQAATDETITTEEIIIEIDD